MRTGKVGLDYFPFDCDFFDDEKVEFISAKYGILGENVCIKLLCRIYRQGYYLEWGEDECILFAKRAGDGFNQENVQKVIDELIKRKFFSESHYKKYRILTSNGIQKRYLEATRRRKEILMVSEYIIADIKDYNVDISPLNDGDGTQRRGEESKEKEKDKLFDLFWLNYPNKKGKEAAKKAWRKIKEPLKVIERMKVTLPLQSQSEAWIKNNGQFIPHPATYLNQGRWEDETI